MYFIDRDFEKDTTKSAILDVGNIHVARDERGCMYILGECDACGDQHEFVLRLETWEISYALKRMRGLFADEMKAVLEEKPSDMLAEFAEAFGAKSDGG